MFKRLLFAIGSCIVFSSCIYEAEGEGEDEMNRTITEHYSNGQKKYSVSLKDGMKNGEEVSWFETGGVKEKLSFVNDTLNGTCTWWWKNGFVKQESMWRNGQEHGKVKCWYENGSPEQEYTVIDGVMSDTARFYHDNGNLASIGVWENGKKEGEWAYFDSSGVHYKTLIIAQDSVVKEILH
ncbi:hypothetical protein RCC89_05940 [Cytophagaceae bacterium ABcell3]|nr:hypothetical protein RCC89_05940 [Cytophagaceae bacterium ABcell3]